MNPCLMRSFSSSPIPGASVSIGVTRLEIEDVSDEGERNEPEEGVEESRGWKSSVGEKAL